MNEIDISLLQSVLRCDPNSGLLFWREARGLRRAGKQAFTAINGRGYLHGKLFGRMFRAHRVVWALAYGEWPNGEIDHINGIKTDNRIFNLRSVSKVDNMRNRVLSRNNSSGAVGVHWHSRDQRWVARIGLGNAGVHLGNFINFDDALAARQAAEARHGFHENHGRLPTANSGIQSASPCARRAGDSAPRAAFSSDTALPPP